MKNILRILFIAPTDSQFAGDTRSLAQLIQGLKKYNIEMMVVTSSKEAAAVYEKMGAAYRILEVPRYKLTAISYPANTLKNFVFYIVFYLRGLWRVYRTTNAIKRIALGYNPDIIHSNTGSVIAGHIIAKRLKIAHVWHVREFLDLDFKMKLFFSKKIHLKLLENNNNHLVFITECIKKHYRSLANSKVIYNGIMPFSQIRFSKEKLPYLLFVGRITEGKGINVLIHSFIDFCRQHKQLDLYIAGDPVEDIYKNKLECLLNDSGIREKVSFLGNRNDVFDLMLKATAIIVPSLNEAFGRISVEALFNGCLVIGNRTAGTQEILEADQLGLLYFGQNELTMRLIEVVTNGVEYYFPMIERAQKKALELYSQEQNVEKVYAYYQEILNATTYNAK